MQDWHTRASTLSCGMQMEGALAPIPEVCQGLRLKARDDQLHHTLGGRGDQCRSAWPRSESCQRYGKVGMSCFVRGNCSRRENVQIGTLDEHGSRSSVDLHNEALAALVVVEHAGREAVEVGTAREALCERGRRLGVQFPFAQASGAAGVRRVGPEVSHVIRLCPYKTLVVPPRKTSLTQLYNYACLCTVPAGPVSV